MLHRRESTDRWGASRVHPGLIDAASARGHALRPQWLARGAPILLLALAGGGLAASADSTAADAGEVATGADVSTSPMVQAVIVRIDAGDFAGAESAIAAALPAATPADALALQFQRERMRRIRLDFDQDAAAVQAHLRREIPDLGDAEFARWDAQGQFERKDIDGKRLYFNRAASNLFRIDAQARGRRAQPKPFTASPLESANPHHREVVALARANIRPSPTSATTRCTPAMPTAASRRCC
jgi:hypothetical protein